MITKISFKWSCRRHVTRKNGRTSCYTSLQASRYKCMSSYNVIMSLKHLVTSLLMPLDLLSFYCKAYQTSLTQSGPALEL